MSPAGAEIASEVPLPYLVEYEGARETQEEAARARKPKKLPTVTDKEWALEVRALCATAANLIFSSIKDDGAKPVETVPGGDSESTPE